MGIDISSIATSTLSVIVVGILLGAGLPLLFSLGIVLQDRGAGGEHADGTTSAPVPAATYASWAIFAIVGLIVLYGLLFITQGSISHYLGIELPL
ncbi:hypothetical protein ACXET9_10735 [Brachybacterium sp. DNPG3]